jgi:hypothetical protein
MKNQHSPKTVAAARAEALSLSKALGRNAARVAQENSSIENPTVAVAVPAPRNKVPLETLDDALAAGKDLYAGLVPAYEEKPEKKKKYRRARLSKTDLEYILSYESTPLPHPPASFLTDEKLILDCYPVPKEQIVDYFTLLFSAFDGADDEFLEMQKRVREEYKKKGYAHHWVTDDEDEAPPSRAARRRARPGVMKHKGGTKKLN